jgi:hypothetical protein
MRRISVGESAKETPPMEKAKNTGASRVNIGASNIELEKLC